MAGVTNSWSSPSKFLRTNLIAKLPAVASTVSTWTVLRTGMTVPSRTVLVSTRLDEFGPAIRPVSGLSAVALAASATSAHSICGWSMPAASPRNVTR